MGHNNAVRVLISEQMEKHPVIQTIRAKIPKNRIKEGDILSQRGYILLNTIKEDGFSVRIYSEKSTTLKSLSVINKTSREEKLRFPSYKKLVDYTMSYDSSLVEEYANILIAAGLGKYKEIEYSKKPSLALSQPAANDGIDRLIECIKSIVSYEKM